MTLQKQPPMERGAGILLPVASLPSPYGIGSLGGAAYRFVDFLSAAGQKYWQVLPIGPTSYGDSPYQSFSAFSGNPYFIDLDFLREEGLLTQEEIDAPDWGGQADDIDYEKIYRCRFPVLRQAFRRSGHRDLPEYVRFCGENAHWLGDYCEYMTAKERFGGREWLAWPETIRRRDPAALEDLRREMEEEIEFWKFCQYKFFEQWGRLKSYANARGISIIGDIPIYVALDSADVWVNGDQFQLDGERRPTRVAGVPPDMFSATGQLWGNPLYRWDRMEQDGFSWWKSRMAASAGLYDMIRIDHFIGVVRYYSIPAEDDTAARGVWVPGPGKKLLEAISEVLGGKKIIAEDLGVVTPAVRELLEESGYPGMKLMEFAFDSGSDNENLPCHHRQNMVVYAGTHDNQPLAGYFPEQSAESLLFAKDYLGVSTVGQLPWALVRAGYASVANTVVFLIQDLLGMGDDSRINTPSTIGQNWRWRLREDRLTEEFARRLRELTALYGR
ncbi:MAG: 4-alpha-glucanotransferase [Oscillospiraceae bacterium]|nr:4-alpha-glucanotransferase [Oscillospiraceae bacterium]